MASSRLLERIAELEEARRRDLLHRELMESFIAERAEEKREAAAREAQEAAERAEEQRLADERDRLQRIRMEEIARDCEVRRVQREEEEERQRLRAAEERKRHADAQARKELAKLLEEIHERKVAPYRGRPYECIEPEAT